MANITITIEDKIEGGVRCTFAPSIQEIMQKDPTGKTQTAAEGYTVAVAHVLKELSKRNEKAKKPRLELILPDDIQKPPTPGENVRAFKQDFAAQLGKDIEGATGEPPAETQP